MKIMVVEDEPLIRLGLASAIEDAGYEVVEALSADDAVHKLERIEGVALVLTDVDMPGSMDGIRLAHYVSKRWPPIRVMVISGKVGLTPGQLPEGARFIAKPCREPVLIDMVASMMNEGGVLHEGHSWQ